MESAEFYLCNQPVDELSHGEKKSRLSCCVETETAVTIVTTVTKATTATRKKRRQEKNCEIKLTASVLIKKYPKHTRD